MCDNPPSLHLLSLPLNQPQKSVECPPRLERADPLVILAFEEEAQVRGGWGLAFEGGADEGCGGLWGRGDGVEGLAG